MRSLRQPREKKRGAETGPRVLLWKRWLSTDFPPFFQLTIGGLTNFIASEQGDGNAAGGFEIDDHLGVRSLVPFDDGAPEACRSFAS
jgi:hypothetical protein